MVEKTGQPFQPGAPSARLAMRGILPGHAELVWIRPRVTFHGDGMKALRHRNHRLFHHPVPFAGPAATCGKPAMHAELQVLDNLDPGGTSPGQHPPVTRIGPAIPCFLMQMDAAHLMAGTERGKHRHRITNPHHKRLTACGQILIKRRDGFTQKIILPTRHVRLLPQGRLKDIERDDRSSCKRRAKRCVILQPQIAFEPDYIHNRSLFVQTPSIGIRLAKPSGLPCGGPNAASSDEGQEREAR